MGCRQGISVVPCNPAVNLEDANTMRNVSRRQGNPPVSHFTMEDQFASRAETLQELERNGSPYPRVVQQTHTTRLHSIPEVRSDPVVTDVVLQSEANLSREYDDLPGMLERLEQRSNNSTGHLQPVVIVPSSSPRLERDDTTRPLHDYSTVPRTNVVPTVIPIGETRIVPSETNPIQTISKSERVERALIRLDRPLTTSDVGAQPREILEVTSRAGVVHQDVKIADDLGLFLLDESVERDRWIRELHARMEYSNNKDWIDIEKNVTMETERGRQVLFIRCQVKSWAYEDTTPATLRQLKFKVLKNWSLSFDEAVFTEFTEGSLYLDLLLAARMGAFAGAKLGSNSNVRVTVVKPTFRASTRTTKEKDTDDNNRFVLYETEKLLRYSFWVSSHTCELWTEQQRAEDMYGEITKSEAAKSAHESYNRAVTVEIREALLANRPGTFRKFLESFESYYQQQIDWNALNCQKAVQVAFRALKYDTTTNPGSMIVDYLSKSDVLVRRMTHLKLADFADGFVSCIQSSSIFIQETNKIIANQILMTQVTVRDMENAKHLGELYDLIKSLSGTNEFWAAVLARAGIKNVGGGGKGGKHCNYCVTHNHKNPDSHTESDCRHKKSAAEKKDRDKADKAASLNAVNDVPAPNPQPKDKGKGKGKGKGVPPESQCKETTHGHTHHVCFNGQVKSYYAAKGKFPPVGKCSVSNGCKKTHNISDDAAFPVICPDVQAFNEGWSLSQQQVSQPGYQFCKCRHLMNYSDPKNPKKA